MATENQKNLNVMCLYPKLVLNPKYLSNKKNKGNPPQMADSRVKYVPVGCGQCEECRRQQYNNWRIRLGEELKENKGIFVTLSFAPEELKKLCDETKLKECNAVCAIAVRRFLERYRKKHKKSIKHWFITEMGKPNTTERIHMHGIIFKEMKDEELQNLWKYGKSDIGKKGCNEKTINYITKYITKPDENHKDFKALIMCSPGIGKNYMKSVNASLNKFNPNGETFEAYLMPDGTQRGLPIYYRNKLYSEAEREKLWLKKLDKQERWVNGLKIDVSTEEGERMYWQLLRDAQIANKRKGFGDDTKQWKKKEYNITLKMLKKNLPNKKKDVPLPHKQTKNKNNENN